jgi:hypothetical protein
MAKENGGIIGVVNNPTTQTASGVWALEDQFNARVSNNWPGQPGVDFLIIAGGGGGGRGRGGGGGAGGYRTSFGTSGGGAAGSEPKITFTPSTVYTITIGAGGAGLQFQVQESQQ